MNVMEMKKQMVLQY